MTDAVHIINTMAEYKSTNHAAYVSLMALLYCNYSDTPPRLDYSKGTFKRAIKKLREAQAAHREFLDYYERAIDFIRREWMANNAI